MTRGVRQKTADAETSPLNEDDTATTAAEIRALAEEAEAEAAEAEALAAAARARARAIQLRRKAQRVEAAADDEDSAALTQEAASPTSATEEIATPKPTAKKAPQKRAPRTTAQKRAPRKAPAKRAPRKVVPKDASATATFEKVEKEAEELESADVTQEAKTADGANTVLAKTVEAELVKARSLKSKTVAARPVKAKTVEAEPVETDEAEIDASSEEDFDEELEKRLGLGRVRRRPKWSAIAAIAAILVTIAALSGSVYMILQHRDAARQRQLEAEFAAAAKQGVVTLTSLDFNDAKQGVQRIADNSTGSFKDDFLKRAGDFTKVVEESKVIEVGTVQAVAVDLGSMTNDSATVLVASTSEVTNAAGAKQDPRNFRLIVTLTRDSGQLKMSKVEFVP